MNTLYYLVDAMLLVGMAILAFKTGILRDANSTATGLQRPYSMARVQGAWWFILIFISYLGLWSSSADIPNVNATVLLLLGIAGGITVTAAGIDSDPKRIMPPTQGFWLDILTDANGLTLARLQMFVWNFTLGLMFLTKVYSSKGFPDLSDSTLGLLGLSGGVYVLWVIGRRLYVNAWLSSLEPLLKRDVEDGFL